MTRSWTMGGGSIGRRSAVNERVSATPFHGQERRTANTTHPGLLRLLSYAEIVLAGPVHVVRRRRKAEGNGFIDEGQGGKGT